MSFYIKGDTRPVLGKNVYKLISTQTKADSDVIELYVNDKAIKKPNAFKIVKQNWTLYKRGKHFFDLGTDGGITFNQSSLGVQYTIQVIFTDSNGISGSASLEIIPVAGKPSIQNLKW